MPEIFHHGTSTEETPSGYPQMPTAASNVIAFPFTADDADAATFPLNKVVFTTDGASAATRGCGLKLLGIPRNQREIEQVERGRAPIIKRSGCAKRVLNPPSQRVRGRNNRRIK